MILYGRTGLIVSKPYRYARKKFLLKMRFLLSEVSKPYRYARKEIFFQLVETFLVVSKPYRYARKLFIIG